MTTIQGFGGRIFKLYQLSNTPITEALRKKKECKSLTRLKMPCYIAYGIGVPKEKKVNCSSGLFPETD
jgi:hypothetical protein